MRSYCSTVLKFLASLYADNIVDLLGFFEETLVQGLKKAYTDVRMNVEKRLEYDNT